MDISWQHNRYTYVTRPFIPDLGPVSRRSRKLFGSAKPFSIVRILKTKKCMGMKLCRKGKFVRIKNMWKEQLCKLKVWDFCCGFPGPKTFRDLRETGPRSDQIFFHLEDCHVKKNIFILILKENCPVYRESNYPLLNVFLRSSIHANLTARRNSKLITPPRDTCRNKHGR